MVLYLLEVTASCNKSDFHSFDNNQEFKLKRKRIELPLYDTRATLCVFFL